MKGFFISLAVVSSVLGIALLLSSNMASAAFGGSGTRDKADCVGSDASVLSFPTWYRGLDCEDKDGDDIADGGIVIEDSEVGTIIFTVSLNIIDIVLRLIGIMAVGFVIYGGFQYVISRGKPEHTKAALYVLLFRHCEPS